MSDHSPHNGERVELPSMKNRNVIIDYINWRGKRGLRAIVPIEIHFGTTKYHPEPQWLLVASDIEKSETRTFAMKDILSWRAS